MPREYKISRERCKKCKYQINIAPSGNSEMGWACGYILITGKSRVYKDGNFKECYRPGYCDVFETGEKKKTAPAVIPSNNKIFGQRPIKAVRKENQIDRSKESVH